MKERLLKFRKEGMLAILSIVFIYFIFHITGIGCPIKYVTGVSCPGCGMTRAMWSLLHFDFAQAFYYHPMWPLPILWLAAFIFRWKLGKVYKWIVIAFAVAFLVTYIIRMFTGPEEVVSFAPESGAIGRLIKYFINQ
ncbi:MAG: DUF2752 domain-containing protein [Lachnospiraceae bacterium]|nr:DUF2752 domain-containing protein [Lachnospiraceae bacterium]